VSGTRGLISFDLFGTRASPHADRLRVRTILSILKDGNPFYTDTDEAFVDWAAGDDVVQLPLATDSPCYTTAGKLEMARRYTASRAKRS